MSVAQIVRYIPKIFLTQQNFGIKFILGPQNISQPKDFRDQTFFRPNKLFYHETLAAQIFLVPKILITPKLWPEPIETYIL